MSPRRVSTDLDLARALTGWFSRRARPLPWREEPRDPWRALVSEVMLQQTQVSRVLEKFEPFLARFPTPGHLARADEAEVLSAWTGLGYYRRARSLHAAARLIVSRHAGIVPDDIDHLRALPGVGAYTAGAIASIVFERAEAIVDGNVARVLLRLHARDAAPDVPATRAWLWERAGRLVRTASDLPRGAARFNEGLMELGATVCTPANPACARCPWSDPCRARAQGLTASIPRPKARARRREVSHWVLPARDRSGLVLLERRPDAGLWGGLWQCPTFEVPGAGDVLPERLVLAFALREAPALERSFTFATSACLVHFRVLRAPTIARRHTLARGREWHTRESALGCAASSPQRRILRDALAAGPG